MRGTRLRATRRKSSMLVITGMARSLTYNRPMPAYAPVMIGPVPVDFILFALILLGIALFHHHTLRVAVGGLIVVTLYKLAFTGFRYGPGFGGLMGLLEHEWVIIANL